MGLVVLKYVQTGTCDLKHDNDVMMPKANRNKSRVLGYPEDSADMNVSDVQRRCMIGRTRGKFLEKN